MTTWLTYDQMLERLQRPRKCFVLPGWVEDGERVVAIGFDSFIVKEGDFMTALRKHDIVRMEEPAWTYGVPK